MPRLTRIVVPGIPHHVHLIAVPIVEQSLRLGIGEAHRRSSRHVNFREARLSFTMMFTTSFPRPKTDLTMSVMPIVGSYLRMAVAGGGQVRESQWCQRRPGVDHAQAVET